MTSLDTVPFLVTPGHTGDDSLILRFPVEFHEEVLVLLDEQHIQHGTALELSADQPLWLEVVHVLSIPGGLAALAAVIRTMVRRHDGKRFVLKRGEFEIEASGYSEKAVQRFLEAQKKEQAELDANTRRVLGLPPEDRDLQSSVDGRDDA